MTTREDVTITHYDSQISATVVLEDGEANDLENVTLSTSGTNDIELKVGDLTTATIQDMYEAAERQYNSFLEAAD